MHLQTLICLIAFIYCPSCLIFPSRLFLQIEKEFLLQSHSFSQSTQIRLVFLTALVDKLRQQALQDESLDCIPSFPFQIPDDISTVRPSVDLLREEWDTLIADSVETYQSIQQEQAEISEKEQTQLQNEDKLSILGRIVGSCWNEGVSCYNNDNFRLASVLFQECVAVIDAYLPLISTVIKQDDADTNSESETSSTNSPLSSRKLHTMRSQACRTISFCLLKLEKLEEASSMIVAELEKSGRSARSLLLLVRIRLAQYQKSKTLLSSDTSNSTSSSSLYTSSADSVTLEDIQQLADEIINAPDSNGSILNNLAEVFEEANEDNLCMNALKEIIRKESKPPDISSVDRVPSTTANSLSAFSAAVRLLRLLTREASTRWDLQQMHELLQLISSYFCQEVQKGTSKEGDWSEIEWTSEVSWNAGIEATRREDSTGAVKFFSISLQIFEGRASLPTQNSSLHFPLIRIVIFSFSNVALLDGNVSFNGSSITH